MESARFGDSGRPQLPSVDGLRWGIPELPGLEWTDIVSPAGEKSVTVTRIVGLLDKRQGVTDSHSEADITLGIMATAAEGEHSDVVVLNGEDVNVVGYEGYLVDYFHASKYDIKHVSHLFLLVSTDLYEVEVEVPANQWDIFQTRAHDILRTFELLDSPAPKRTVNRPTCKLAERIVISGVVGRAPEPRDFMPIEVTGTVTNNCDISVDARIIAAAIDAQGEVLTTSLPTSATFEYGADSYWSSVPDLPDEWYFLPHPSPVLHLAPGQSENVRFYLSDSGGALERAAGVDLFVAEMWAPGQPR